MKAILTSTSDRNFELNYRLPNGQVTSKFIPAYALNHEILFSTDEEYETFKSQNHIYFEGEHPVLIEGKASSAKAERIYDAREKVNAKKITAKAKEAVEQVASATQDSGVKINVEVDAVGSDK